MLCAVKSFGVERAQLKAFVTLSTVSGIIWQVIHLQGI